MSKPESEPGEPRSVNLPLHSPLRLGMAADPTRFMYTHKGRILYHDQRLDQESHHHYTLLRRDAPGFSLADPEMAGSLGTLIGEEPDTERSSHASDEIPRMPVVVSKDLIGRRPWSGAPSRARPTGT